MRTISVSVQQGSTQVRSGVDMVTATGAHAAAIQWVFGATSKDTTRSVLCGTVWLTKAADGAWWTLATDGRRLHGAKAYVQEQSTEGIYHPLLCTARRVVAVRDIDGVFPNAWQVVPKATEPNVPQVETFVSHELKTNGAQSFKLFTSVHKMHGSAFNADYIKQAALGFTGRKMLVYQASQYDPMIFCDSEQRSQWTRFAVIMPLRID